MSDFIRTSDGLLQFTGPISVDTLWRVAEVVYAETMYRVSLRDPAEVTRYIAARIGTCDSEHFMAIFLDTRHRVITSEVLFHGTIDGASVHPREVVKRALHHNACAVIFGHNHPSGVSEPSPSDIAITKRLREALALVDIRILDHIVVAGTNATSLAARGLI